MVIKTVPKKILDKLPFPISGRGKAYKDTSFVAGDSPVTLDVNTDLGRNGKKGFVVNDGAGNIDVEISDDGSTFSNKFTMEDGETFNLNGVDIDSVRLTWIADSAFRAFFI